MAVKNSRAAVRRWLSLLLLLLLLLWAAAIIRDRYWPPKAEALLAAPGATRNTDAPATSGSQAAPRLEFTVADGGKHVSGSFGDVRFEAQALGAKQARARFWLPGSDEQQVTVAIEGVTQGLLIWQAHEITGRGAVDDVTAEALATLAQGPMAAALARVPLDLACQPEVEPVPAALGAALLMPWQALLKYVADDPAAAAERQSAASVCGYFGRRPAQGLLAQAHPNLMMLSREGRVPAVFLFLPFDGAGQRGGRR